MAPEIIIREFSFRYWKDAPDALTDVNLAVGSGSICAILGPTNSGKTTLLQGIAGVLASHHTHGLASGQIRIGDQSYEPMPRGVLFPTVGMTIQEPHFQVSGLRETVREEIALTLESMGVGRSDAEERTETILRRLGLSALGSRKPFTLSGGELQRVALATILIAAPPVLLMDEPCNSLDASARQHLTSIIRELKGSTTIVVADNQIDFVLGIAETFVVLDRGRIVFSGRRKEFVAKLSDFTYLLPVTPWIRALEKVWKSPAEKRILRLMDLL